MPPRAFGPAAARTLVLLLVVGSVFAGLGAATGLGGVTDAGEYARAQSAANATDGRKTWRLSDVEGREVRGVPKMPASTRYLEETGKVTVWHDELNPLKASSAKKPWEVPEYLEPNTLVRTNEMVLRFRRPRNAGTAEYTVHVLLYEVNRKTVQQGNTTTTTKELTNATYRTQKAKLEEPIQDVRVNMPRHYNRTKQYAIWLTKNGERVEGAVWYGRHLSSSATEPVDIQDSGDLAAWVLWNILIWGIGGTILFGSAARWLRSAAEAGPQWGYIPYVLISGFGGFAVVWHFWAGLASLWTMAPYIAGFTFGVIGFVQQIEGHDDGLEKWQIRQLISTDAVTPAGEEARDVLKAGGKTFKVKMTDRGPIVIKPGWLAMTARAWGRGAFIEPWEDVKTKIRGTEDSEWDQELHVKASAEQLVDYQQEGWSLKPWKYENGSLVENPEEQSPDFEHALAAAAGFAVPGALLTVLSGPLFAILGGTLGACVMLATPVNGHLRGEWADVHERSAEATAVEAADQYQQAETFEEQRKKRVQERAEPWSKAMSIMDAEGLAIGEQLDEMWGGYDEEIEELEDDEERKNGTEAPADD